MKPRIKEAGRATFLRLPGAAYVAAPQGRVRPQRGASGTAGISPFYSPCPAGCSVTADRALSRTGPSRPDSVWPSKTYEVGV